MPQPRNCQFQQNRFGISVLMPVHNGGTYLNAAVTSILEQQQVLLELILIDDHSTDNAIKNLTADARLRVLRSPGRGIVAALNHGLKHASYPFIARMDGDDIAAPDRLRTQLHYLLEHPNVDIVGARVTIFKNSEELGGGYAHYQDWINGLCEPDDIARSFFIESPIPHPTAFMRRSTLAELAGYQDNHWPEDYDLWCRAHLLGKRFAKPSSAPLLHWRDHGQRASRVNNNYTKQAFLRCKAHYLANYLAQRSVSQCCVWGAGPTGLKLHDYLQQNGVEICYFIDVNKRLANRQKRGKAVIIVGEAPTRQDIDKIDRLCIVAVSARGARNKIKTALLAAEQVEMRDFILAA